MMKLRIGILLAVCLATWLLCACQPTPEADVVVNKGDGKTEQAVMDASREEALTTEAPETTAPEATERPFADEEYALSIPGEWDETLSLKWLDVVFDHVPFETGDLSRMPVYAMRRIEMFNEYPAIKQSVLEYFLSSATGVRRIVMTKADYERQMERLLRGYYDEEADAYLPNDPELVEQDLKVLQELYQNAPEEVPYEPFDPTILEGTFDRQFLLENGSAVQADVSSRNIKIWVNMDRGEEFIQRERWLWNGDAIPGEPPTKRVEGIRITQESALEKAQQLMEETGLADTYSFCSVETARSVNYSGIGHRGYYITYLQNPGGYIPVDYSICSDHNLKPEDQPEAYADAMGFDCITMLVDENGVCYFQWNNPFVVVEKLAERVRVLDYAEMREVILQTLKNCLSWIGEEPEQNPFMNMKAGANQLKVRRVVLGAANIRPLNGAMNEEWNIPVWFVEFSNDYSYNAGDPNTMLAFNAIDGSLLDLGY